MTFIFWQNMLSIHQSAFIRALAEIHTVVLVAEEEIEERRKKDRWHIPNFGKTIVNVRPSPQVVDDLLSIQSAVHIFSGVASYPFVHTVFKKAIKLKLKVGIISEPYNWLGITGRLRHYKYLLFNLIYGRHIDFVMAIGHRGRECFEKANFSRKKIFDWGYFTEECIPNFKSQSFNNSERVSLIYVGSLSKTKGIIELIKLCKTIEDEFNTLTIIGDGHEKKQLIDLIGDSPKYHYLGNMPNESVLSIISNADLMILPSLSKDGWGAVVNESLMLGIPVITSDYCGASVLLDGQLRGETFSVKQNNLLIILSKWVKRGKTIEVDREKIRAWAKENICGSVAAEYFLEIIKVSIDRKEKLVKAPWLTKQ